MLQSDQPSTSANTSQTPQTITPPLDQLDNEIQQHMQLLEQLKQKRQEAAAAREKEVAAERIRTIAEFRARLGAADDLELINIIRGRPEPIRVSSSSGTKAFARRFSQEHLDQMKDLLTRGAKVPELARHMKCSEAAVNNWKAKWKLTGRKNVKLVPIRELLAKGKGK